MLTQKKWASPKVEKVYNTLILNGKMVGATGIEPVTPAV
jgi:hypothetical protein